MTKNGIAKNINHIADITRILSVNYELDFVEGEIYDNRNKAESWSDRNLNTQMFIPENDDQIMYVLEANNVPCYLVDYENSYITNLLGATDCESEGEVIVRNDAIFIITYASSEDDFKEMGYYIVELDFLGFKEELEVVA